jgi:hypothetical protein
MVYTQYVRYTPVGFQPFLRFYRSCGWFLLVFKFFCCFLSSWRSVWSFALHSFHTALGRDETPFFGASQKQKRREEGKITPFFAVPLGVFRRCRVWAVVLVAVVGLRKK